MPPSPDLEALRGADPGLLCLRRLHAGGQIGFDMNDRSRTLVGVAVASVLLHYAGVSVLGLLGVCRSGSDHVSVKKLMKEKSQPSPAS